MSVVAGVLRSTSNGATKESGSGLRNRAQFWFSWAEPQEGGKLRAFKEGKSFQGSDVVFEFESSRPDR